MAKRPKTRAAGTVKRPGKAKPAKTRRAPAKAKSSTAAANKTGKTRRTATKGPPASKAAKSAKPTAKTATSPKASKPTTPKATAKKAAAKKATAPTTIGRSKTVNDAQKKTSGSRSRTAATSKASAAKAAVKAKALKGAKRLARAGSAAAAKKPPHKQQIARAPAEPRYLAEELGQPVDYEGEPIGAGSAAVRSDKELQDYTLQLWRQMQSGGVVNRYMRAIERAGLTVDEVWTAGVVETRSTSSTADEMRRYREKLLFRANLLEAILSETVADLHRLEGIEPGDAPKASGTAETTTQADASGDAIAAPAATA